VLRADASNGETRIVGRDQCLAAVESDTIDSKVKKVSLDMTIINAMVI